jgi:hypothetical protein
MTSVNWFYDNTDLVARVDEEFQDGTFINLSYPIYKKGAIGFSSIRLKSTVKLLKQLESYIESCLDDEVCVHMFQSNSSFELNRDRCFDRIGIYVLSGSGKLKTNSDIAIKQNTVVDIDTFTIGSVRIETTGIKVILIMKYDDETFALQDDAEKLIGVTFVNNKNPKEKKTVQMKKFFNMEDAVAMAKNKFKLNATTFFARPGTEINDNYVLKTGDAVYASEGESYNGPTKPLETRTIDYAMYKDIPVLKNKKILEWFIKWQTFYYPRLKFYAYNSNMGYYNGFSTESVSDLNEEYIKGEIICPEFKELVEDVKKVVLKNKWKWGFYCMTSPETFSTIFIIDGDRNYVAFRIAGRRSVKGVNKRDIELWSLI